jgi:hypothetical protein
VLLIKVVFAPIIIGLVALVSRKWGPVAAGLVAGLPLTSGPVSIFIALENGNTFAVRAAKAALMGVGGIGGFCAAYGTAVACSSRQTLGSTASIAEALFSGSIAFFAVAFTLHSVPLSFPALACGVSVLLFLTTLLLVWLMARVGGPNIAKAAGTSQLFRWELSRAFLATIVILTLTASARALGAALTGLLSPLPVLIAVVTANAHRAKGAPAVMSVLLGATLGSFGFVAFFVTVALTVVQAGISAGYLLAIASTLLVQSLSLCALHLISGASDTLCVGGSNAST